MSILNSKEETLSIRFRQDFKKASFGFFHVAFLDNHDNVVLPMEDKDSITEAMWFYENRILKRRNYPVREDGKFIPYDPRDKKVLEQVLGLPKEAFQKLNINKDIVAQIHFQDGLSDLKKECYVLANEKSGRKWFSDDFRLYCLKKGFFFLYDETKPFMNEKETILPVFIDERLLDEKYLTLYKQATSERFAIDFPGKDDTGKTNEMMRKFDSFSFDERLSFFVNGDEDERMPETDISFREKYTFLLKEYLSCLINALYDDYCFTCLNKVTEKLSFLSVSTIHSERDIHSISSYLADMYSLDKKNYAFAMEDKKRIELMVRRRLQNRNDDDMLSIYASLGLPYEGFAYVKDLKDITVENIISHLPFISIGHGEIYLSSKRYDTFYSYLSGEETHKEAFCRRLLLDEGISYDGFTYANRRNDAKITIRIDDMERKDSLKRLFDIKGGCTFSEILSAYQMNRNGQIESDVVKAIYDLDEMSCNEGLYTFYHIFDGSPFEQIVSMLLMKYDRQSLYSDDLLDFLWYVLCYPFVITEHDYRIEAMTRKDTLSLLVLDGLSKEGETYEPNLPYPYVTFGKSAYSFRKQYFSTPVFCSCQKEALKKRYDYYSNIAGRNLSKEERNRFILDHMLLPNDVIESIDLKKNIFSQLHFEDHVCHLCNHTQPSYHESIDDNHEARHNVFMTYIRSRAAEHGVFFDEAISYDFDFGKIVSKVDKGEYHSLISFDRNHIDSILLPYINISKKTIISLLCYCFPDEITYDDFYNEIAAFSKLDDKTINDIIFDCKPAQLIMIFQFMNIFPRLIYIYKMLEISYALYLSRDIVPASESQFCMNIDHNPSLRHPFVLLGSYVNAYCDSLNDTHYYICDCEKDSLIRFGTRYSEIYDEKKMSPEIKTPVILGLLGLPYPVILKYQDYDLVNNSVKSLMDMMDFGPSICRRCSSIPHSAHDEFCMRVFPFREDLNAEYHFAKNMMMHQGFRPVSDKPINEIIFRPEYRYDLNAVSDPNIPFFEVAIDDVPEALFTYFIMPKDKLRTLLEDFSSLSNDSIEANAYSGSVILDSCFQDDNCIFDFVMDVSFRQSLKEKVFSHFPQMERVRKEFVNDVCQQILGFITYLFEKFFLRYAQIESHTGR